MKKTFGLLATLVAIAGTASAATSTYNFVHETATDGTQDWGHATSITADGAGGVYFTDNFDDTILNLDNPLTDAVAADVVIVADTPASFGSFSFQGVTFDGTSFFAAGDNNGTTNLVRFVPNNAPPAVATSWTTTVITMPAGRYAGVAAVGPNKLVMVDRLTGAANFFTVSGSTATLDGTVAGPGVPATSVAANSNSAPTKLFVASPQGGTGAVYTYTTNGTVAGTSYTAGVNPLVAAETSSIAGTASPLTYGQVAYNSDNTLAVSFTRGTNGNASVKLYDVTSATGPNITAYQTLDGTGTADGAWDTTDYIYGLGFFTRAGKQYLAVGYDEGPSAGTGDAAVLIYGVPAAAVNDWTAF